jgi:hypothetical protein
VALVKLALRFMVPSLERKVKLPPAQLPGAELGQLMVKAPEGVATLE